MAIAIHTTGAVVQASETDRDGKNYKNVVINCDGALCYFGADQAAYEQAKKFLLKEGAYVLTVSPRTWNNRTNFDLLAIAPVK